MVRPSGTIIHRNSRMTEGATSSLAAAREFFVAMTIVSEGVKGGLSRTRAGRRSLSLWSGALGNSYARHAHDCRLS